MWRWLSACVEWRALSRRSNFDSTERVERAHRFIVCRVADVYDGDTFTVALVDADGKVRRRRCRCGGYDAPEMKGPTKEAAILAKTRLKTLLPENRPFRMETCGLDKYGRLLVWPRLTNGQCIADIMIAENHGYAYYGGTKRPKA